MRSNDQRVVPLIPPPITSPDRELEPLDVAHEVLLAEIYECMLEPEHLREEVNLLHESELPGLELAEVFNFAVIAEVIGVLALVLRRC